MDNLTYAEMLEFKKELDRWKFTLRIEMEEKTDAPQHMIVRMSVEDMIDYLLNEGMDSEQT